MSKRIRYTFILLAISLTVTLFYPLDNYVGQLPPLIWFVLVGLTFVLLIAAVIFNSVDRHNKKPAADNNCEHKDWGLVIEGYQYCNQCKRARAVLQNCCLQHKDEIISEIEIPNKNQLLMERELNINSVSEVIYINRCEICGRIERVPIKFIDNG